MATDIMGLFAPYDPYAAQQKQQAQFQQNLASSLSPQQFMATVGTQFGSQLGQGLQGMLGGKSQQEQRQALRVEALRAVQASGVNQSDGTAFIRELQKQLRARGLDAEALALENQAQDIMKNQAYVQQVNQGSKDKYSSPKALDYNDPNYALLKDKGVSFTRSVTKPDGTVEIQYLDSKGKPIDIMASAQPAETPPPASGGPSKSAEEALKKALAKKEAERKAQEAAAARNIDANSGGLQNPDWAMSGSGVTTPPVTPPSSIPSITLPPIFGKEIDRVGGGLIVPPGLQ